MPTPAFHVALMNNPAAADTDITQVVASGALLQGGLAVPNYAELHARASEFTTKMPLPHTQAVLRAAQAAYRGWTGADRAEVAQDARIDY